ncbi:chemotaxis protein, partial [Helicobacter baculiformis]
MFRNLKLGTKVVMVISLVLLFAFGILGVVLLRNANDALTKNAEQILKEQTKMKATNVIRALRNIARAIFNFTGYMISSPQILQEDSKMQDMLTKLIDTNERGHIREAFLVLLDDQQQPKTNIGILKNAHNQIQTFHNDQGILQSYAVRKVLETKDSARNPTRLTKLMDGSEVFGNIVALPIKIRSKMVAIVAVFIDFERIQAQYFPTDGQNGFLLGRRNTILALHADHKLQGKRFVDIIKNTNAQKILDFRQHAAADSVITMELYSDVLKKDIMITLYTFRPFNKILHDVDYNWVITSAIPKDEVLKSLYTMRKIIIGGGFLTLASAIGILWFFLYSQVIKRLRHMSSMLGDFFKMIRHEHVKKIPFYRVRHNDEIGLIFKDIITNIQNIQNTFEADTHMVTQAMLSTSNVQKGVLSAKNLECHANSTPQLCELVSTLCAMIASLEKNVGSDLN